MTPTIPAPAPPRERAATRALFPWRLLLTPPASGPENMALDEALMARARASGAVVLRVYAWSEPTLSLGRHQPATGRYDLDAAAARGVHFVRRPTGGRAVLHHREITYSVTAPDDALGTLRESYRRINRLLVGALHRLGVTAEEAQTAGPAPRPGVAPCFEEPVHGEIVAGGRKLIGSAQWRDGDALLQHGSILVDDDQPLASALLRSPVAAPPAPATLRELMGRAPSGAEFLDALCEELIRDGTAAPATMEIDAALRGAMLALTERYLTDDWTWRC